MLFCGGDLRLEFAVSHMKYPTFPVYSRRFVGVFSAFFSPASTESSGPPSSSSKFLSGRSQFD